MNKKVLGIVILAILLMSFAPFVGAATIYDTSLVDPPGYYNGTGNPNVNFTVGTGGGVELGLSAIMRFVGPITPTGNTYNAPTGESSPGRAKWNFQFSVNTQYAGGTAVLNDYVYRLSVANLTAGTSNIPFDPIRLIPDNAYWGSGGETAVQSLVTQWGAQNSENLNFAGFGPPGFDQFADALYQITLEGFSGNQSVASVQILVNVGNPAQGIPEPGTFALFAAGLAGLAYLKKK